MSFPSCANPILIPKSSVINFIAAQPGATLFVTDVTLAEITYGIEQLGDAGRRTDLRLWRAPYQR
jgi:hypothetical protein